MKISSDYIEDVSYLQLADGVIKAVIVTEEFCRNCVLKVEGQDYPELYNYFEPFDFFTHVFLIPRKTVAEGKIITFVTVNSQDGSDYFERRGQTGELSIVFSEEKVYTQEKQFTVNDSGITIVSESATSIADGVTVSDFTCKDANNAPVKAFMFTVNMKKASLYCGTPFDGYEYINKKQTVEGEAKAALANGKNVLGAVNADFFDMFGDCRPSGLCVKNGSVIANANSKMPFFAVNKMGEAVISSLSDGEVAIDDILQAVSGRPIILKNGNIAEFQALEPFGFTRHPRTAIGVRPDGTVLVLIIDGRLQKYSNGATLLDVALFLRNMGVKDALNLDGGGSCTFLVRNDENFDLINNPADLFRPADKLIRDVYNSLLIVQ